jgi:site-specific DNA-methyltransferase (adenine-specific)
MTPADHDACSARDSLIALRDLPDASVDALITDPPYSSGGAFRGDRQAASSAKYVGSDAEYPEIVGDNRGRPAPSRRRPA